MPLQAKQILQCTQLTATLNIELPIELLAIHSNCIAMLGQCFDEDIDIEVEKIKQGDMIYLEAFMQEFVRPCYRSARILYCYNRDDFSYSPQMNGVYINSNFDKPDIVEGAARSITYPSDVIENLEKLSLPFLQRNGFTDCHFLTVGPPEQLYITHNDYTATVYNGCPVVFKSVEGLMPAFIQIVSDILHGSSENNGESFTQAIEALREEYPHFSANKSYTPKEGTPLGTPRLEEEYDETYLNVVEKIFASLISKGFVSEKTFYVLFARFRRSKPNAGFLHPHLKTMFNNMQSEPKYREALKTKAIRDQYMRFLVSCEERLSMEY